MSESGYRSRPETVADLDATAHLGDEVCTLTPDALTNVPGVMRAAADLITAAQKANLLRHDEYRIVRFHRPKTGPELDEVLRKEQAAWDSRMQQYEACLVDLAEPSDYSVKYAVQRFCKDEGLTPPWQLAAADVAP